MSAVASLAQAGQSTTSPVESEMSRFFLYLLVIGLLVLLVLTARRIARPRKLALRDAPGRPNSLNPIHVLAVFLIWLLSGALAAEILRKSGWAATDGASSPKLSMQGTILATVIAQTVGIGVALACAHIWFRFKAVRGMGLSGRHWLYDSLRGLVAVVAFLPVCLALLQLGQWMLSMFDRPPTSHPMLDALVTLGPGWQVLIGISAILLAALTEELIFRGLLQSMLRRYVGPWPAIVIASVLFGFSHGQLQAIPTLIALGIMLGYNYERTGRLWAPIVIHAAFNGIMVANQLLVT
jgi:membrane protease YdiL (CAAX protease family)